MSALFLPPEPDQDETDTGLTAFAAALRRNPYLADAFDDLPPIPRRYAELIRDRLDAAWAERLLNLTPSQYADVLCAIMPDDFVPVAPSGPPAAGLVGTAERVANYLSRADRREPVTRPTDPGPPAAGIRIRPKKNGAGAGRTAPAGATAPKVIGPAEAGPRQLPGGMYRDARGRWFELCDPGEMD